MRKTAALAAGVLAMAAFLYVNRDWPRCWKMQRYGVAVEGRVIGKSDAKAGLIYYAYRGPAKLHTAAGKPGEGVPRFGRLAEGDAVTVYFLPAEPDVSMLGSPDERLLRQHTIMVWSLVLIGAAGWALYRAEMRRQAGEVS